MSKPGSTTKPGYLYHEPAFPVPGKKYHRSDNLTRLRFLLAQQDWQNARVLDVGCNVGFFTNRLALEGAKTVGIDPDTDALEIGRQQAYEHGLEAPVFLEPNQGRRYAKDKDVVLLLSVIPWIYATEPDPEKCLADFFAIPTAYVEIPYPPDGRANVPGVDNDTSAWEYLHRWYPNVERIAAGDDRTDGVLRNRTIWKCWRPSEPAPIMGSQCMVEIGDILVTKRGRPEKPWNAAREAHFLQMLEDHTRPIFPLLIDFTVDVFAGTQVLREARIAGSPATTGRMSQQDFNSGMSLILRELEAHGVSHNDIRPANLIIGVDGLLHLLDFGWATRIGDPKPEGVNPRFGTDDRAAAEEICRLYPLWAAVDKARQDAEAVQE